jgi:WD40 repeat protein
LLETGNNNAQVKFKVQNFGAINGLSSDPSGVQLMAASDKGFIYRLRTSDFSQMLLCESHTESVNSIWFMPGVSDRFITSCGDGTVRLWDSNDYSVIARCVA